MKARPGMLAVAAAITVVVAGCGSSGSASEGDRTACKAPAATQKTGLPAAFPIPGELTITRSRKDGPAVVVDGYWSADLTAAYTEYRDQVARAGYDVLFDEHEAHDAEISYRGSGRTGQIALRDDCTEAGTTRVHITNRPAS